MHDQNFKNLILNYPLQALQFFAANEAIEIDESVSITPIRQEQLKQRLGGGLFGRKTLYNQGFLHFGYLYLGIRVTFDH